MWPGPEVRAGDADRKQVVADLQQHYVDGRLSADELSERVSQAMAARTFGDLASVLVDLPKLGTQMIAPVRHSHGLADALGNVPIGAVFLGLALVTMLGMFVSQSMAFSPGPGHGAASFWPLIFFGFFFFGRPRRR